MTEKYGIYVHLPFCVRKCLYCDFVSSAGNYSLAKDYIKALKREIQLAAVYMNGGSKDAESKDAESKDAESKDAGSYAENIKVDSIFFGGGTPSSVKPEYIKDILDTIRKCYKITDDAEITLEANPGTVDAKKLAVYKDAGINRISMGLQSSNDKELEELGRIHRYKDFVDSYELCRFEGFNNINVDIMSGLPGQSLKSYEETLKNVISLNPEHISAYSLIIEEETPFFDRYSTGKLSNLPDEATERKMYYLTRRILSEAGYEKYEISNYSKPGYECKHNIKYWSCDKYLGFGIAAASYTGNERYKNIDNIRNYIELFDTEVFKAELFNTELSGSELPSSELSGSELLNRKYVQIAEDLFRELRKEREILNMEDKMSEFMFLGLRMIKGVSKKEFFKRFGKDMEEIFGDIIALHNRNGLLIDKGEYIALTEKGIDVSNYVMSDFIL